MPLRRSTQPPRRVVEPFFAIPEGLDDLVHDEEPKEDDLWFDVDEDDEDPLNPRKKKKKKKRKKKKRKGKRKNKNKTKKKRKKKRKDDHKGQGPPNTPKTLQIVKQTLRTKPGGFQTVDIVVEVDKINRADKYEFRVTKRDTGKTTVITG